MEIERVQRWVMSTLLFTVMSILAGGLALLSDTTKQAGGRPALLIIGVVIGLIGVLGVRVINEKSWLTPWLVLGVIPVALGWWLTS